MSPANSSESHVIRAATRVAALFGVDKVLGLVRDMVISRTFGASAELDAYYAAFELPDGLFTVVAGSALATALIPVLAAHIGQDDRAAVWRLTSAVLNLALLIVAAVSIVAAIFAPQVIAVVAPGFDAYRAGLATRLMRLVLLQTLVSSASGITMSVLQAHQHFLLPAAAPLAYTLGRIGGALFLAPHLGIFGLAVGGLLGTLGHFLIQVPGLIHVRARWWPALTHPDLPQLLALMGPRMLGLGATYLNFVLPTFLGSRLAGGAISAYEYGWRLMQFPETLIGTALGLTVYPTLAAHANAGDHDGLRRTAGWTLRLVLALAIPAGAALVVLGRPFTALLLQRGAFDAQATARVAQALRWLAPGLVGHAALEVVSRAFYARRDMWTPLGAAVAGLLTNAVVGWLLLPVLAQGAIALANSTGVCLQVVLLLAATHRRDGGVGLHHQEVTALARSLARTLAGTALMTLALLGVRGVLAPEHTLLVSVAGALVGGTVYLAAAWLLRHEVLLEARHRLWGGPTKT